MSPRRLSGRRRRPYRRPNRRTGRRRTTLRALGALVTVLFAGALVAAFAANNDVPDSNAGAVTGLSGPPSTPAPADTSIPDGFTNSDGYAAELVDSGDGGSSPLITTFAAYCPPDAAVTYLLVYATFGSGSVDTSYPPLTISYGGADCTSPLFVDMASTIADNGQPPPTAVPTWWAVDKIRVDFYNASNTLLGWAYHRP